MYRLRTRQADPPSLGTCIVDWKAHAASLRSVSRIIGVPGGNAPSPCRCASPRRLMLRAAFRSAWHEATHVNVACDGREAASVKPLLHSAHVWLTCAAFTSDEARSPAAGHHPHLAPTGGEDPAVQPGLRLHVRPGMLDRALCTPGHVGGLRTFHDDRSAGQLPRDAVLPVPPPARTAGA